MYIKSVAYSYITHDQSLNHLITNTLRLLASFAYEFAQAIHVKGEGEAQGLVKG